MLAGKRRKKMPYAAALAAPSRKGACKKAPVDRQAGQQALSEASI